MEHLPSLITDLAIILVLGSLFSLLCKILKQPIVLGYIVAGFIAGPHFAFFRTINPDNISTWADIGVIFLLFGMGLEFSFKKMFTIGKIGGKAVLIGIPLLIANGFMVGKLIGWSSADSILLGSMLVMSSTTIIIKVFADLGLQKQRFASIVFGILIFEDLFAILVMVFMSTLAVSKQFEGMELVFVVVKLMFFLIIWIVAGVFLIPTMLKKLKNHLNDEILLLVSMGLCLAMVIFATKVGFSSALGAFIMGSLLAETIEQERIEKVVAPIKDFFGAIFFVSVGMMVNPELLASNFRLVIIISLATIFGKTIISTMAVRLAGQDLKTSMLCGYSLAQVGEFSFIVASTGMSLGLTSDIVYPIIIAVSVLTTFTTPYCVRLALPAYELIETILPKKWHYILSPQNNNIPSANNIDSTNKSIWLEFLKTYFSRLILFIIICVAILLISFSFLYPYCIEGENTIIKSIIGAIITLVCISPLLKGMIHNAGRQANLLLTLWTKEVNNRFILSFFIMLRVLVASGFVFIVMNKYLHLPSYVIVILSFLLFAFIFNSKKLLKLYWQMESRFVKNFNAKQIEAQQDQKVKLNEINNLHWIDSNIYFAEYEVNDNSLLNNQSLKNLNFRNKYNLIIISVGRKDKDFDFPDGDFSLQSGDKLWILGTIEALRRLDAEDTSVKLDYNNILTLSQFNQRQINNPKSIIHCLTFVVEKGSQWIGNSLIDSTLMQNKCVVIAIERNDEPIINPSSHTIFKQNDMVWVMGDKKILYKLLEKNYFENI